MGAKFEQAITAFITAKNTAANVPITVVSDLDNVPKTGDAGMTVWWVLMTGPALMAAGFVVCNRRKKHSSV